MTDPGLDVALGGDRAEPPTPLPPPGHPLVAVAQVLADRDIYGSHLALPMAQEPLVHAMVLHALYGLGPDPVAVEHLTYNQLFRWFLGTGWRPQAYVPAREQLLALDGDGNAFARAVLLLEQAQLLSVAPFQPDFDRISAWSCEALLGFDDLARLDDRSLQRLLKDISFMVLGTVLWQGQEELLQRVKANMSTRMAGILEEEMGYRPAPPTPQEIQECQAAVVLHARKLAHRREIRRP
jgi:hypothetical protein